MGTGSRERSPPSIESIDELDLRSDARLRRLYAQAVQRGYWPNAHRSVLEFACLAEKALQDDTYGTPGKLFYALLKRKDTSMVSQAAENRAMRRFPGHVRQEMVDAAARSPVPRGRAQSARGDLEDALAHRHIGYAHAILLQCFLPQRPIAGRDYETSHGRASLAIEAGRLANPEQPNRWVRRQIPAGPKARLILPYLIGQAVREGSPRIDLGTSLRKFLAQLDVPVTGHNGRAVLDQTQNLAAANILIGEWTDDVVHTHSARIARSFSFWRERNPGEATIWTPTMTLSDDFFLAVQEHRVPVDIGHLARLGRSPRRMDLYAWLSYRTPRLRAGRRQPVSLKALWPLFGPDIRSYRLFKSRLRGDLKAIAGVYRGFQVEVRADVLWLGRSKPPVPFAAYRALPRRAPP